MIASIAILFALVGAPQTAAAQTPAPVATLAQAQEAPAAEHRATTAERELHAEGAEHGKKDEVDFMEHILDSREVEIPFTHGHYELPAPGSWMVGSIDMTPTRHVVYLGVAGLLTILLVSMAAAAARRAPAGRTQGRRHNALEALVLFIRNDVVMRNIDHGEKYAPFIVTLFFFVLFANLLGLVPGGSTATANVSVTAALAIMTFVIIEVTGMMAMGTAYLGTIFYWNKDLALPMRVLMFFIMTPVEVVSKITKPFALAIRLMANMVAGHVVLLAIISLIFVFQSLWLAGPPLLMAIALNFLEIFVGFLQAFIFALLASVFIGMMRHAHH
jgi:F-type H+-transporting ATPase subunit a